MKNSATIIDRSIIPFIMFTIPSGWPKTALIVRPPFTKAPSSSADGSIAHGSSLASHADTMAV
ncbi:MAG: hypothetical protein QXM48_02165 [Sulfolobales archaeon]